MSNELIKAVREALKREESALAAQKEKERIEKENKQKSDAEENARIADAEYRQRVIEETIQSFFDNGYHDDFTEQLVMEIVEGKIKNIFIKF